MEASLVVAPDLVEAFGRDDAVCIRGAFSADDLALDESAIERNLVTHAPREWTTSPDFPGLANELAAGAPLDNPLLPIV